MLSVKAAPQTLSVLGDRYEILGPIGAGAAANVFRVRDTRTGAIRAAKVLKTDRAASADTLSRFEDEFRILRTLHHPHLPEVYDYGSSADGGRYLIMEMVDGEPLDVYFRAHPEDIWVILYELCEALVFVHARNLLHQDIKPSNILVARVATPLGERPLVKLIDFGLTYQRGTGAAVRLVGTAEYVSPEVVRGEKSLTRAVDYYSLGATLFELLCGTPPFSGSESEVLRAHLEREPVIEQEELEWAELYPHVRALLSKDTQARLAAFEDFRRAVIGRLTGGIEDLDRSYALARIDSLGMIGKREAWGTLSSWLGSIAGASASAPTVSVSGVGGVGKRFLAAALRAEAAVRGVRALTPAEIGDVRSEVAAARQPALMWSRLLEICEKEPAILVVETPHALPDEERSFVRLAGTQWELSRSRGRTLPLFFLVLIDSTTDDADVLDYLPSENAIKLELAQLTDAEREEIVSQFRGSMFDARDARALGTYLGRFHDAGSALQGLQQAVLRDRLTFVGQRWKVQPGLLTELVRPSELGSFSRDLVASLSALERRIAAVVAAHPDPVPRAWAAEFAAIDAERLASIIGGSLKRLCSVSPEDISPATDAIRDALLAGCEPDELRSAHEFLAARLEPLDLNVSNDRSLAHHYQQLGRVRDTARVHLRLLRAYWSIRPRERPYELIEGVCRSGLELLEAHGRTVTAPTRRHLFCFYLKEWIKALWARNLFTHAKPIIDEWTKRLGETMPASVAPRYVRSVLELEGAEKAFLVISTIQKEATVPNRQLRSRLELERALSMHNTGDYAGALDSLASIDDVLLSTRDRYRLHVYRVMNLDEVRGMGVVQTLVDSLVEPARLSGCVDEAVLMYALRARSHISAGAFDAALHDVALGIRIAHRNGLNFRENLFYRLGATAYSDMSDVRRARVCQQRALQIAGVMGIGYLVGTSLSRLVYNECALGRFGNAVRYGSRAVELMRGSAPERDLNQAYFALYTALVFSRTTIARDLALEIEHRAASATGSNERGYYHMSRGRDFVLERRFTDALAAFRQAREDFLAAGYPVNVAWAQLREARVHLEVLDHGNFVKAIDGVREVTKRGDPRLIQLDFRIAELKGAYVFRERAATLLQLAHECEDLLRGEPDVPFRIEMLQILFRVYARNDQSDDAERAFARYRELVSEVVANADSENARPIAEAFDLGEFINEYELLLERKTKRGPNVGPLFAV